MIEKKAYINGKWINSLEKVKILSPETSKVVGTVPALKEKDIKFAFKSARMAQKSWEFSTIETRIKILMNWAVILEQKIDLIAEVMVKEIAKPIASAKSEIRRSIILVEDTISEYRKIYKHTIDGKTLGVPKKIIEIILKPLGVILAISPFNYPINLAISKLIPALLTGNTVVFKSATNGSLCGGLIAETLVEAGIPPGVFNFVTGRGRDIGNFLTSNNEINGISFTGSEKVGMNLSKDSKMAIIILELGGKDVAYVRKDADLELASKEIIKGAFSYSGQRCTAIKRVFVHQEIKEELINLLDKKLANLVIGKAINNADITAVIDLSSRNFILNLISDALKKGAKTNNKIKNIENLIYPVILHDVTQEMDIAWEEQFGPVLPILTVSSDEEAILLANKSRYGLQSSIFTKDIEKAREIALMLEVGSLNINGASQRGPDALPFTGVKISGLNVQGIKYSIWSLTRPFNIINNK